MTSKQLFMIAILCTADNLWKQENAERTHADMQTAHRGAPGPGLNPQPLCCGVTVKLLAAMHHSVTQNNTSAHCFGGVDGSSVDLQTVKQNFTTERSPQLGTLADHDQ